MKILATIDLAKADIDLFEAYEARVLALLARHGGKLAARLRAVDGLSETHLLTFPDAAAFEAYRYDPDRIAAAPAWNACRARASFVEVIDWPSA